MKQKVKLFLTDFDGVMTDGYILYSTTGEIAKRFHSHDGMGIELLRLAGLETGIITTDNLPIVEQRGNGLGFTHICKQLSRQQKLSKVQQLCAEKDLTMAEVAYMGDDVNCCALLKEVGHAACPANAQDVVKNIPGIYVTEKLGGQGALREWIVYLLSHSLLAGDEAILNVLIKP